MIGIGIWRSFAMEICDTWPPSCCGYFRPGAGRNRITRQQDRPYRQRAYVAARSCFLVLARQAVSRLH